LSKGQSELLASRVKGWNLLEKGTKICYYRQRQHEFQHLFSLQDDLVYCNNVDSLLEAVEQQHNPGEWRLFIDSSRLSLKAVLLHNGNKKPSIPLAFAAHMKESYDNMKFLLTMIQYEKYLWYVCGDLKVISLVLGLSLVTKIFLLFM
jgi:hypothetical protein